MLDASVTSTVACVDEDSPCFLGCSVFGQVLLHTCILETGSGSLLSEDSDETFLLESVTISAVSETRRMAGLLYQGTIPDLGQKRDSVRMTKD